MEKPDLTAQETETLLTIITGITNSYIQNMDDPAGKLNPICQNLIYYAGIIVGSKTSNSLEVADYILCLELMKILYKIKTQLGESPLIWSDTLFAKLIIWTTAYKLSVAEGIC